MAYDEGLAQRIREWFGETITVNEKRMFGGLAFLEHGNLVVGVVGDELMVRLGAQAAEAALARPGTRTFDFTGRPMRGWLTVGGPALDDDATLAAWITEAREFTATLPPK